MIPAIMAESPEHRGRNVACWLGSLALLAWLSYIGYHRWWRPVLLVSLSLASLLVGSLIGFIFTSYNDEAGTVGKVKDWLIGALAGLTIVEFKSIKGVLQVFALTHGPQDFALVTSTAIVFTVLGFFFMFFGRELIFNVPLAEARAKRSRVENTHEAGVVTLKLISAIPSSILVGIDDADDLKNRAEENAKLAADLDSQDVKTFLDQSEKALASGVPLDWDVISKVAYLQYYRAYLDKNIEKGAQQKLAYTWIQRALVINPQHVDLMVKRADVLALMKRWKECVAILDTLRDRSECPLFVLQWLGYYALYLPGHEDEAIRASQTYLSLFPGSNESQRNIACAFAQKVCLQSKAAGGVIDTTSADYVNALANAKTALLGNPDYITTMRTTWLEPGGSFECFKQDQGYRTLVGLK
jgi:hypothetical protein